MRFILPALLLLCFSCSDPETSHLEALKKVLADERRAHFERNVDLLMSHGVDPLLSVNRGSISYAKQVDSRERFSEYFNSVDFIKWDDMREPVFNFSEDSTLAVVSVQKIVVLREKATQALDSTQFAWTAVYRRIDGEWKMTVMTSTNK